MESVRPYSFSLKLALLILCFLTGLFLGRRAGAYLLPRLRKGGRKEAYMSVVEQKRQAAIEKALRQKKTSYIFEVEGFMPGAK